MRKESRCAFKAGQHEKEWRVRASSNGNKGGERKKPRDPRVQHLASITPDYIIDAKSNDILKACVTHDLPSFGPANGKNTF
jgi:hypothetical protein